MAEPVDIYLLIRRMVAVFADTARRVNLQIIGKDIDVVLQLPIPVRELEQIFLIVIQNAIDAAVSTKAEKPTISCAVKDKQIHINFTDNCRGIPPRKSSKIYFSRSLLEN